MFYITLQEIFFEMLNEFLLLYVIKITRTKPLILFYLKFYNVEIKRYLF